MKIDFVTLFLLLFLHLSAVRVHTQLADEHVIFFNDDEITFVHKAEDAQGFDLFYPTDKKKKAMPVTVFVHGYGAINPMIYGKWIRHLVGQGHIVIYPRYQLKILSPPASEFAPNTAIGIKQAFGYLDDLNIKYSTKKFYMTGHSYGGVITAHLAARYEEYDLPKPKVAFVCEPGTGPLKGGILDSYEGIEEDTRLAIIVGDDDQTVGQKFGLMLYEMTGHVEDRMLVWQYENVAKGISASHYEPYSLDESLDTDHRNFTANKAYNVSKFDEIDTELYWKILDELVQVSLKPKKKNVALALERILAINEIVASTDRQIIEIKK